jgi:hypothetical protein
MGKPLRFCIPSCMVAMSTMWLPGSASADEWFTPFEWFPLTQHQWQGNTLGSGRIVSLEIDESTLVWRVDFQSQSGSLFRTKKGTLQINAPDHCDETHLYTEIFSDSQRKSWFYDLERGPSLSVPPTRAEQGDVASRWRAFVARGPAPAPRHHAYDPASCESIRSRCVNADEPILRGGGVGLAPEGFSINARPRFIACDQADQAVARCIERIRADEARHAEAVAHYTLRMRCSGLAIVTLLVDEDSITLEVVSSANDEQWARAQVELDERVDASGWVFAPLTVLVDIPFMVINAPLALVQALYGATQY